MTHDNDTSDFAPPRPGAVSGKLLWTCLLLRCLCLAIMGKHDVQKTGSRPTQHRQRKRSPGHRQHAREFGEILTSGFWDMLADRQTDRLIRWSQPFAYVRGTK